ncbi:FMN-binding negative transcriptional regulator [Psychrosphaera sp. B3R10]|uniref:FMN-binding negative transcriptional regulator n=1 Tax=unclassified Psychrosphaera TaxID=2641570 RepID=UPI001C098544|nr:FMN-binding negative transcriptional regulator [Psychrosphaera sp. 1_MG-2023]MBU2883805.1 FMN-binding negative transcriptional regulator [Psychrosphaera sp. I2R16]MBU2990206.1 FMN-binding negative transcriptional regulator [Psychrosphaera sp. B3R10]MDO6720460.1 FMN-binding negative transcriptional regulator [Psychrosphaera sp. 1_MG-2023]
MYVPRHFKHDIDDSVFKFIENNGFAQLISSTNNLPEVTFVPILLNADKTKLICHVANQNPQAKIEDGQIVLVSFSGPHGYVSPSWYESAGVPTWNYQAVNVYGKVTKSRDPERLTQLVNQLTDKYERYYDAPWQPEYPDKMLRAITLLEIEITDIQAKSKLSQNRSRVDQVNVINALNKEGNTKLAEAMKKENKL